jgi:hypothetical protein
VVPWQLKMSDEKQIVAVFTNGVANLTGSVRLAERVKSKIVEWKNQLSLLSVLVWATILYILLC